MFKIYSPNIWTVIKALYNPLETTIVELEQQHQQQQTRPLPHRIHRCYFSVPTFLKFRFRVLFWRHSQTQLVGSLNDQIRALPESISSRHKHLRHWSQSEGEAENGPPAAGSPDRRSEPWCVDVLPLKLVKSQHSLVGLSREYSQHTLFCSIQGRFARRIVIWQKKINKHKK